MRNGCKITCISDTKLEFAHRHSHLKHLDSSTGLFWAASVCLSLADLNHPSLFVKVFISVLVRHVVLPWNHHVPCIWYVISSYFVFVFKNVKEHIWHWFQRGGLWHYWPKECCETYQKIYVTYIRIYYSSKNDK